MAVPPPPPLPPGKLPSDLLARLLAAAEPLPREVRLGPAVGEDACVLDGPPGPLVAATDPITLTGREIGRLAVIINANDVAVTGVRPRWFLATVLLPPGTRPADVDDLFTTMRAALTEVDAALVGGHTEVTEAVRQPVIVGQMLGVAEDGRVVTTSGAAPGDTLVQVGPAPVEGAAVLAAEAVARLEGLDPDVRRAAAAGATDPELGVSVVRAALAAARLGATSMHDPTEGGLAAALHELATAAGVGISVDRDRILWFDAGVAVCHALGADPWGTLASGTLLATFGKGDATGAVEGLRQAGHRAAVIGAIEEGAGVRDAGGAPLPWPDRDEVARVLSS